MFGLNTRSVVFNLILINVLLFIITLISGGQLENILGLHYFANPEFRPYQLITHMFMHGGWMHILFNMYALWLFGTILERVWGPRRFLTFYMITGFGAVALHVLVQALVVYHYAGTFFPSMEMAEQSEGIASIYFSNTVGASGAIFGVLVGFGMLFPNTELYLYFIPIPIKAKYLVIGYVGLELFLGISNHQRDVAHFAHLGGALFGFLLVKYWNRRGDSLY